MFSIGKKKVHLSPCKRTVVNSFINIPDERESPQEVYPAWEKSSLGFIEAVNQWS